MYWNFIRLFVSLIFHAAPIINQTIDDGYNETLVLTSIPLINIILSYVITVDAEIVKVIEGKSKKKTSSSESKKSISQSSYTPSTPSYNDGHSTNALPKYQHSSDDEGCNQVDEDKIVIVSMKRLSFFEWANLVVGGRDDYDGNNNFNDTTSATESSTLDEENLDIVIN
jgi:hypothetical protein